MKPRRAKPLPQRLFLMGAVGVAVLLLLLRMLVFVFGHGRRP
jgi:hypothetical protein